MYIGLRGVEARTFSRQSAHRWRWGQPYASAGRSLSTGRKISGTQFCWRLSRAQGYGAAGKVNWKVQWSHRESNLRLSALYCSAFNQPWFTLLLHIFHERKKKKVKNSVAWVGEPTVPIERPSPVGEVSANFLRIEMCRVFSAAVLYCRILGFLDRSRYFILSRSSAVVLTKLSGLRSRPNNSQKIW
jgi:hypothetical protein